MNDEEKNKLPKRPRGPSGASDDIAGYVPGDEYEDDDSSADDAPLAEAAAADGPALPFVAIDWEAHAGDADGMLGAEVIQTLVRQLPNSPGVYRMMNASGDVLYVGKARNLKKRVTNYAQGRFHTNRIGRMVRETSTMEFVVTRTETEALLLEANLIKRLRPRFNVLMRDDKSFPYILLTGDHPSPGIFKHRGARSRKGDYFGPFASAGAVGRTINSLQRAFLLRTCTDSVFESRTRPCLLYQIKRCSGPCTGEIGAADYAELVTEAKDFLSGRSQKVKSEISVGHAGRLRTISISSAPLSTATGWRRCRMYRAIRASIRKASRKQTSSPSIRKAARPASRCSSSAPARTGATAPTSPKPIRRSNPARYWARSWRNSTTTSPARALILLSTGVEDQPLLAEALSTRAGNKVTVTVPQRGEKKDLTDHALQNAREALGRRLAETSTQARLLTGFAETFGLAKAPQRIEVYDNSHIMGTNAVGAMIVAGPEGFVKNQYRKFNIRSTEITPGDDFGMMREVMERRFSRLLKEHGTPLGENGGGLEEEEESNASGFPAWPDVILIDGGQGQMSAVRKILDDLGVSDLVTAIGVAKGQDREAGRERFFVRGRDSFSLPVRDPVLYFVQRMRDEAHRFAIGSHRARRKKEMVKNPLDEIGGIGPGRKRALLLHFGTAKAVSRAAMEDLMAVDGISEHIARQIYNHFHENG